ncbi:MAG: STAS domain-containing protein, partial [Abditibacteriota bacterium]|nr:STAS domain-containing protein [Abditibacteriota bacterium]
MIIETKGDTITLNGVLDKNIWPALQAAVAVLLKEHPAGIIIDCGSITRITPAGIGTFASAFRYITQKNAGIIFVSASEEVISLARATEGVRSKMPVAADAEEARHSLSLRETVIRKLGGKNNIVVPLTDGWQTALAYAVRLRKGKEYRY